jgi:hypothetical protein
MQTNGEFVLDGRGKRNKTVQVQTASAIFEIGSVSLEHGWDIMQKRERDGEIKKMLAWVERVSHASL